MRNKLILLLCLACAGSKAFSQESFTSQPTGRGKYALVAYINGGAGYFISKDGAPSYLHPKVNRIRPVTTVRILWHPDHLLKAGLETGFVNFYSYTLTDSAGNKGKVSLQAVPVLLVWSMSVSRHFNIFAGSGAYFLDTRLDYGTKSTAKKFSVGWMAAASYIFPLSEDTGLGTEAKWLYAAETSKGSLCLQVQFVWKFLKW
jgi:hypothetical protein